MNIKCMLDKRYYSNKPTGAEIGAIQNRLKGTDITIKELANELIEGASFRPSFLMGTKETDWISQQIFALDFDNGTTLEEELNKCKELNILPVFAYTSFSHATEHHKFRLVFCMDNIITDYDTAKHIQTILMGLLNKCDKQCSNIGRLYFGGRDLVYENYNSVINHKELLTKHNSLLYNSKFGLCDYNKKYIYTSYHGHINPLDDNNKYESKGVQDKDNIDNINSIVYPKTPSNYDTNYNVQAIRDGNITYLHSVLSNNDDVLLQNEQEFYDYIKTEIDLAELLGVDNPSKFKCVVHDDNNPSAGIFVGDSGDYIYNCFGCGFKGNVIHVIQALTKMKTYRVIEFIKKIYNIKIVKTDWQQEQISTLETNKHMLISGDFEKYYPKVYKLIGRYIPQLIMMHDVAIMNVRDENFTDENGDIVFFISNTELTRLLDGNINNTKRINQRNVLFAFLKLLKKLDKEEIPEEDLKKALEIQKKYKHGKMVNYFSIGDYDIYRMKESEERATIWTNSNMTMRGLSYEGIYRTFGQEVAGEVYPQHKNKYIKTNNGYKEINRTTSKASDSRTDEITIIIMNMIGDKGYATERDIVEVLREKYSKTFAETQLKRSLQEILESYDLKRVRANNKIKEQLGITKNGYPFLLLKNN